MAAPTPSPPRPAPRRSSRPAQPPAIAALQDFWRRISEGMELDQLWSQFRNETRTSYRLYSREVQPYETSDPRKQDGIHRGWHTAQQFFWAIVMKLSPAKRVVLLVALALLAIGNVNFQQGDSKASVNVAAVGVLLIVLLLVLEIADRVTMKRDLEIAREIQGWLTPASPPQVAGLDIAFVTRPANTVAGDYYDAFPRGAAEPGAPIVLIVADVAGKSIPAAMLMATLHASLHTLALTATSVNDLAVGLNRYCSQHSSDGRRFTTAFLAEFDPPARQLRSINAGHNPPVLLRAGGAIERLNAGGVPFGISPAMPYESESHTLESGDVVFIFSDGLVEAENEQQQEFGEAMLMPVLEAFRTLPAREMMTSVMQQVEAFVRDTPQHDDITCMVVRVQ